MAYLEKTLELKKLPEKKIAQVLREHSIGLTAAEAAKVTKLLGRNPTLTEATIWSIQGSEHSSYKSSKRHLKMLPTDGPNVMLGPSEDAGIVEIAKINGKRYGIVISHESHNHPSQVVPYEGAATGIGGNVRDVLCMGAHVIAVADPLRFGDISRNQTKLIAGGVIDGIGGYGNPIGVPNIGGDVYFNKSFNDNCLVNVVTLGLLAEDEIIHSRAPKGAAEKGYEIILVGKPTDFSGMGGAAFASLQLREEDREKNKGAVQEPNPFLKRHIMESTYDLFRILKEKKLTAKVGFKDLGAGGIICSTVEMVAHAGYGANIDLEKVHVSMEGLPPHVIACSETQERMCWMAPKELTKLILNHYNEKWALPKIAKGARASVIGKVTKGNYVLRYQGAVVCDAKAGDITAGLSYNRPFRPRRKAFREPKLPMPRDLKSVFLKLLAHENIACRAPVYESYDKNVQGLSVIEAGQADAGVIAPFRNREDIPEEFQKIGVALSTDANPLYGQIDPYWQAANAVVESCRNVAAVGATPLCITDCLNYGNPEKPDQMWEFVEGVSGVADALKGIGLKGHEKTPLPCISGNVSLYNASEKSSIAPQAVIATLGRMENTERATTMKIKSAGNHLFVIGPRKNELGGSAYYNLFGQLGANIPQPDFKEASKEISAVTDIITEGLAESCHDISDGGLAVAIAEMCLGGSGNGKIGAKIVISTIDERPAKKKKTKPLRSDTKLFSETGGFILEITRRNMKKAKKIASAAGVPLIRLGFTTRSNKLVAFDFGKEILNVKLPAMRRAWMDGLREKLR
ncbi:phosphoribosylformylglycinamidine synthase subunit PurL [Candidatus Peregrinibacteria bacterium]|nr:phosphoribosylformylglycinamidine synthase subunit PurL [Candidatus Peregrinibacteria bacterium]